MAEHTNQSIAVVIISKDEASLEETLQLLKPQCEKVGAKLFVVDASEKRLDWIREANPWVVWFDYEKPLGRTFTIPQQRNFGVKKADSDIVVFCDSGSIPSSNWLSEITKPILEKKFRVTSGPIQSTRKGVYKAINDQPTGTVVSGVLTANLAFETSAFEEAGGFNEAYDYGSDVDFAYRLLDKGISPISVQTAQMGMDWGEWGLQRKRSWRYGRARARLLSFHPKRRIEILRTGVVVFVYPPLVIFGIFALAALYWCNFVPTIVLTVVVGVLLWRNREIGKPWQVLYSHLIYSSAMIFEMLSRLIPATPVIVFTPKDKNPYQQKLINELKKFSVRVDFDKEPTNSASINLLLWPLRLLRLKLGGTQLVHLHWPDRFVPKVFRNYFGRSLAYLNLKGFLFTIQALKLKLIYTAHNLTPHEKLFNEDAKATKLIIESADAVVLHHESSIKDVSSYIPHEKIYVIPEGINSITHTVKNRFGKDSKLTLVMLGQVRRYKGITNVLVDLAATKPERNIHLLIAGECKDSQLEKEIQELADKARSLGWKITLRFERLEETELDRLFFEADGALFAFTQITNSGSALRAIANGTPVIVPEIESFDHFPSDVAITYQRSDYGKILNGLPKSNLQSMRTAVASYSQNYSWEENARKHLEMYRRALRGK